MKQTTKMSRAVGQLEKMYNVINAEKFNGELPVPIITIQSKPGTWGHCSVSKVWRRKDEQTYEMNIAAESVCGPIEEIIDTLIHEMVHLYCREHGIQEVSRGGKYHNNKFKQLAEEKGLICYKTEKYGWNTQGTGNDGLIQYAIDHDWSEIDLGRTTVPAWVTVTGTGTATGTATPTQAQQGQRTSSTRKYQCPKCKNSVRATKDLHIICGDCMEDMVKV